MENISKYNTDDTLEIPEILKFPDVVAILRVSPETIRRYIKRSTNPLPVYYLSADKKRTPRFLKEEVLEWLKTQPDPREDI